MPLLRKKKKKERHIAIAPMQSKMISKIVLSLRTTLVNQTFSFTGDNQTFRNNKI